jgi:hypothetical protein
MSTPRDYFNSGFDIQGAMIDQAQIFPKKEERPPFLLWNGLQIKTSDGFAVPEDGVVTATILSWRQDFEQGFDLKLNGWLGLEEGERISLLRTWKDDKYEDRVRYVYHCGNGILWFWNVYKRAWPGGRLTDEKWTGNAGFWIEELGKNRRIYHCSHGLTEKPDFSDLVVELVVEAR